ncbi:hypothetical protein BTA35_0202625 [Oceanospirillum linum]|uniref:Cell division protein FtsQ n=1 Tax=Oceanospirillum linum TaxID=966 RepID=A0A1T1HF00_OCELI|nr:FtsQ-type POTRA domain-containing protein [Oceanospirillum linum]OOV88424.1 hypothetical protein BTA35_0202625 [Oceanospirillum linum]SEF55780.1 cell division protein FtsQ [Oleiphilus messinensis]SMP05328.1 cell division protein FtsQ [Oceanospirillum linum]
MFSLPGRINWLNPLVLTGVFVLLVAALKGVRPLLYWPVDGVRVVGSIEHVDKKRLQYVLAETLSVGFLASDLNEVKEGVESLPWVAKAQVSRVWPEQIEVAVTEKKPVANWLQNGFLDSNLDAFFPADRVDREALPKLAGPKGSGKRVWDFYRALSARVKPIGLSIDVVSVAKHGAWSVHLEDGPWLLVGKEQTTERIGRIGAVYSSLKDRWSDVRLIDLRYPNGFSVEWVQ